MKCDTCKHRKPHPDGEMMCHPTENVVKVAKLLRSKSDREIVNEYFDDLPDRYTKSDVVELICEHNGGDDVNPNTLGAIMRSLNR